MGRRVLGARGLLERSRDKVSRVFRGSTASHPDFAYSPAHILGILTEPVSIGRVQGKFTEYECWGSLDLVRPCETTGSQLRTPWSIVHSAA